MAKINRTALAIGSLMNAPRPDGIDHPNIVLRRESSARFIFQSGFMAVATTLSLADVRVGVRPAMLERRVQLANCRSEISGSDK